MTTRKIETGVLYREFRVDRAAIDEKARTVRLAFSSETPYERYFGVEILDHGSESIRLDRLTDGAPLLMDHTASRHVGVIENVTIGSDRVGRAVVRFGRNGEADLVFKDVVDGIRSKVSVGYWLHAMVLESEDNGIPTYRVSDWEPLEISMVAIPADPSVGVARAADDRKIETLIDESRRAPRISTRAQQFPERRMQENYQERAAHIAAMGASYSKYVTAAEISEAIAKGTSATDFQDQVMRKMQTAHGSPDHLRLGMSTQEVNRYSIGRAIQATIAGDWKEAGFEREASTAIAQKTKLAPAGFFVPLDALLKPRSQRDFTAGTAGEAGNLIATELRGDLFTDALRAASVLPGLGCTMLYGLTSNIDLPRKSTAGTVAMVTEVATASETQPATVKITLTPHRISAFIQASRQAIIQGGISIEDMLRQDLLDGSFALFENQAINGSGSSPNCRGIRNVAGIGSVVGGTNGIAVAWTHFVALESAVANANAEPDRVSGYCINTKTRGTAKTTQKATNLPFCWDGGDRPLNDYRAGVTNNVPSNLTKGTSSGVCSSVIFSADWSLLVLGVFGAFDVTVDPYSQKASGIIELAINAYIDVGCRQPAAFATMDDALTP